MKTYPVTLLEIGLLSGTRAIAAGGLALAIATRVPREKRGPIGWSLLAAGSVCYLAMVANVVLRTRRSCGDRSPDSLRRRRTR